MNDLLTAVAIASGIGFGFFIILRGLRRKPVNLAVAAAPSRYRSALGEQRVQAELSGLQRQLSDFGLRGLEVFGAKGRSELEEKLRVLDKTVEQHAYEKMLAATAGFLFPWVLSFVGLSPIFVFALSFIGGFIGFMYPDLPLNEKVAERQQAFRYSLSSYLDLVGIILAGGGGTESALQGAAEAGDGWVFAELRQALRLGDLTGQPPWEMFDELGRRYGVNELTELAASISLAGGHGARVRQSLTAKADALRVQQSTELETQAEANTEKMVVPVTIMVFAMSLFIAFAAISSVSSPISGGQVDPTVLTADAENNP